VSNSGGPGRPSLPGGSHANGAHVLADIRRVPDAAREPGSMFISAATAALGVEAAGLLYVSFAAQYAYVLSQKPGQRPASAIEALMLDSGMIIFSFLALGLARKGLSSRTERALILTCAGLSAAMNYAASDTASWRSVAVYVIAPVFLAMITDRVIASVRRHVLGLTETSAWTTLGRGLAAVARTGTTILLYLLRFALAPASTATGLRCWLLAATPLPSRGQYPEPAPGAAQAPARTAVTATAEVASPAVTAPARAGTPAACSSGQAGPAVNGRAHHGTLAPPQLHDEGTPADAGPPDDTTIEAHYAAAAAAGRVPSRKAIRTRWNVGSVRADRIHGRLSAVLADRVAQ
jgi:hypothetical protein